MTPDISTILSVFEPSIAEITTMFSGLSKMSPEFLQILTKVLDPGVLAKMSKWAVAFAQKLNDLGPEAFVDGQTLAQSMHENDFADFFAVMGGTTYVGPKLDFVTLINALHTMVTFDKGNDWEQAIFMGITIAKFLPV